MIPCIEDILKGLAAGDYTVEQANRWIREHMRLDAERAAAEDPDAYMYQHDETGRITFRTPDQRMVERRWVEIPLYAR